LKNGGLGQINQAVSRPRGGEKKTGTKEPKGGELSKKKNKERNSEWGRQTEQMPKTIINLLSEEDPVSPTSPKRGSFTRDKKNRSKEQNDEGMSGSQGQKLVIAEIR